MAPPHRLERGACGLTVLLMNENKQQVQRGKFGEWSIYSKSITLSFADEQSLGLIALL